MASVKKIKIEDIKMKGGGDFPIESLNHFTNQVDLRRRIVNCHDDCHKFHHDNDLKIVIDALRVYMLAFHILSGKELQPIVLRNGWLYDGMHRVWAYMLIGKKDIDCVLTTSKKGE